MNEPLTNINIHVLLITVRADYGGGPEHVYRLAEFLVQHGVSVNIACPMEEPYWERYATLIGEKNILAIPHRKFTIIDFWRMVKFTLNHKIEVIHSHGKGAGIYGRLLGLVVKKPCVHTFHGIHVGRYGYLKRWIYLWIERCLSSVSDRLISVSQGEATIIQSYKLCSVHKLGIIPNGVAITDNAIKVNKKNKRYKVITMSRFDYSKNSELVLKIAESLEQLNRVSEFEIVFLGSGPGEAALKNEVQRRGLETSISFTGAVPNPGEYLQDAFCYLSTSRWEGMPLAVLEAMSTGLPVVATNVVGNRDVVEHNRTGFLYDIDEPYAAAKYLCLLKDDYQLWKRLSDQARQVVVDEHSVDRMARQVLEVYKECTQS